MEIILPVALIHCYPIASRKPFSNSGKNGPLASSATTLKTRYSATLRLCVKTQCSTFLQRRDAKTRRHAELFSTIHLHLSSKESQPTFQVQFYLYHSNACSGLLCGTLRPCDSALKLHAGDHRALASRTPFSRRTIFVPYSAESVARTFSISAEALGSAGRGRPLIDQS